MDEANGGQPCPGCGANIDSQYCPHCGARTQPAQPTWFAAPPAVPFPAAPPTAAAFLQTPAASPGAQVPWQPAAAQPAAGGPSTASGEGFEPPTLPSIPVVPTGTGPFQVFPEMFPTEAVPPAVPPYRAWSQAMEPAAPPAGQSGLFPGWTGMHPAVAIDNAPGVLAPRPQRRRRALYAVLAIAAATAVVLLAALLIAPHWGGTASPDSQIADKQGQGLPVSGSTVPTAAVPATPSVTGTPASSGAATGPGPVATTVTVTATPSTAPRTGSPGAAVPTGTAPAVPAKPAPAKPTPTKSVPVKPVPTKPAPAALPLGVPQRDITCSSGYIVQLASALDRSAFQARVAALKSGRQVPAGSLAADSAHSCDIFATTHAVVLYAGPFTSAYDGCAARLAGPADAFIKGGNTGNAHDYISCLCPAAVGGLPPLTALGQSGVWVGELQRVLGKRLNIPVSDLAGNWGVFTAGTRTAVQTFQRSAKLPANGFVDVRTWAALQHAQC